MKYFKMLGLLAVAATALMAFTGSASATILTSPAGTTYTGSLEAESSKITTHYYFGGSLDCLVNTMEGSVESQGALVPAVVKLSNVSFSSCNWTTEVIKPGVLEIESNGTVLSTGLEILVYVPSALKYCIYTTKKTEFGTLTGSSSGHAVLELESVIIPRTGGYGFGNGFACGPYSTWTGNYTITTPGTLLVE